MPTLVKLSPYDPNWPNDFSAAEILLRATLGTCVVSVDHIGSTAVPGLAAKATIDIDVTISKLDDVPDASAALVEAGFEPRGNRYNDEVWVFLRQRPTPHVRVYLCPPANHTHRHRMMFRDYLRQHDEAVVAYALLKRRLADEFPYDGDRYTSEKRAFISEIVERARSGPIASNIDGV